MTSPSAPRATASPSFVDMLAKTPFGSAIRQAVERGDVAVINAAEPSLAPQKHAPVKPR